MPGVCLVRDRGFQPGSLALPAHSLSAAEGGNLLTVGRSDLTEGKKSAAEQADFRRMLGQVNLLYLGASVLGLVDLSYLSRFWVRVDALPLFVSLSVDLS